MRVQLVFAPAFLSSPFEVLGENIWPPLGILYLASYLRSKMPEVEIKITDGCRISYKNTIEEIGKFKPDIVGISFYTIMTHGAIKLALEIKQMFPETMVVLGGPHVTALPEDTLLASNADIAVLGEGEETFYRIVKLKKEGKTKNEFTRIPGTCFVIEGKVHKNSPDKFITPIDSIPFPAWDLVDTKHYKGWYLSKQQPDFTMLFSRGCPYDCTFCSNGVWKTSTPCVRLRSPENIVDEIGFLRDNFSVREVFDNSDEFNNNIPHALEICREIKKRKLGVTWKAQLRVSPFTEELAREMAEAGCWYVHLGIESGNQETIDGIEKHINLKDVESTCILLKRYGIKILALFMLFNVWEESGELRYEDKKLTENTLKFAWKLAKSGLTDYISWSFTTPYPGSKLYEIAQRHNIIKPLFLNNWEAWQKEGLFVMELPAVGRKTQVMIKIKGEILRARCLLKSRNIAFNNLLFLIKRALHIVRCGFK
jgi:radical SAM superfamily enzyme YgiQ (UPF0313 family)